MTMHRIPSARIAVATFLTAISFVAGCGGLTESNPVSNRYGAVNITAKGRAGTSAAANATVIFFSAFSAAVPNSVEQTVDQCVFSAVDTTTTLLTGANKAGASVALALGATTVNLPYQDGLFRYANLVENPISYSAGDVAVATIPGGTDVFPASNISVKLAEPIYPGAAVVPAFGSNLVVTWNASADTTTAILVSVRYANPVTSTFGNEQILCALKDDGRFEIPASALTAFLAAPNATRTMRLTRWRTRETLLDAHTILHIATSIDSTVKFP